MMNAQPSQTQDFENEADFSLYDVFEFVKNNWKWLIGFIGLGLLGGLAYALTAPERYEARASLQMAVVSNAPVESPQLLAEKMKHPGFYSQTVSLACGIDDKLRPGLELSKTLMPTVNANAPIVEIKFQGSTPQQARTCLENVIELVKASQAKMAKSMLDSRKLELEFLETKLNSASKFQSLTEKNIVNTNIADSKFSASVIYLTLVMNKKDEIEKLSNAISNLKFSLEAPLTDDTKLVVPIYSPEVRISPNRKFIMLSAAFGGFFVGLVTLLLKNGWVKAKQKKLSTKIEMRVTEAG